MDDRIRPALYRHVFVEDPRFCWREQAIEAPQHGQRQDHLAVFVALVRAAEQVADAPDEIRERKWVSGLMTLMASKRRRDGPSEINKQ